MVQDGTASIGRVISFLSDGVIGTKHQGQLQKRGDGRVTGHSDEDCDVLEDARNKLRAAALKFGTSKGQRMSPRRLFEYLDPDGMGEVRATHRELSHRLSRILLTSTPLFVII